MASTLLLGFKSCLLPKLGDFKLNQLKDAVFLHANFCDKLSLDLIEKFRKNILCYSCDRKRTDNRNMLQQINPNYFKQKNLKLLNRSLEM